MAQDETSNAGLEIYEGPLNFSIKAHNIWKDGWAEWWMDGWIDGWMEAWTDGLSFTSHSKNDDPLNAGQHGRDANEDD